MRRARTEQITLKPQDLLVLFKMAGSISPGPTYAGLGASLGMAASQVHASFIRCLAAKLLSKSLDEIRVDRRALREFVIHGAKYSFPPTFGAMTRGIKTAYAGPALAELISQPDEPPPVWPHPDGHDKGIALFPIYPSAPEAAMKDSSLYELLSLFDALRSGAAREREIAKELLERML